MYTPNERIQSVIGDFFGCSATTNGLVFNSSEPLEKEKFTVVADEAEENRAKSYLKCN